MDCARSQATAPTRPMATPLRVSRGSFYWHFRDIADFRSQVLQCWQERTTEQVIRDLEPAKAEPDRLKHLMRRAFVTKRSLERAIRSWAAEDKDVAATVAAVDTRRVSYIAKMLVVAGVESRRALPRATFMYWHIWASPSSWIPAMRRSPHLRWTKSATCLKSERALPRWVIRVVFFACPPLLLILRNSPWKTGGPAAELLLRRLRRGSAHKRGWQG